MQIISPSGVVKGFKQTFAWRQVAARSCVGGPLSAAPSPQGPSPSTTAGEQEPLPRTLSELVSILDLVSANLGLPCEVSRTQRVGKGVQVSEIALCACGMAVGRIGGGGLEIIPPFGGPS